jgi:hypothetical protein
MQLFKNNPDRSFPLQYYAIAAIYFILSLWGIIHHEIWLDEMHHFLLARDSNNFSDLYYNARYDGHPLLWDGLLFILTRFTHDPFFMQLLHIFISLAAVIVFLRNAPFTDFIKLLFIFGYFMFFEYNIISRNYAISVLMLFTCCSLLTSSKKNYIAIFISLLILSYTHLFALIIASVLVLITIFIYKKDVSAKINSTSFRLFCILFSISFVVILLSLIPPADHLLISHDATPYLSFKRIGKACSIFFKGFYHLPNFTKYHFWNTNLLVDLSKNLSIIPSVFCFFIPLLLFHDKPVPLLLFYFSSIGIALFIFCSPIIAGVRYFGYITLLFIVALWFDKMLQAQPQYFFPERMSIQLNSLRNRLMVPFILSFLFVQLFSSIVAYSLDIARPFSEGKEVADYLKANLLDKKIIVIHYQSSGPPICGYLDRKVFYPETNDTGSFCHWNTIPELVNRPELIASLKKLNSPEIILILNNDMLDTTANYHTPVFSDDQLKIYFLKSFNHGIMRSENYAVFDVKKIWQK